MSILHSFTVRVYCKAVPKRVDHEQRRAEIIVGLWAVINGRGIEGVTYQAVAQATGISVGRIQHYFASKDDLILAGCRAIVERASDRYANRAASLEPHEALRDLLAEPIPHDIVPPRCRRLVRVPGPRWHRSRDRGDHRRVRTGDDQGGPDAAIRYGYATRSSAP